VTVRGSDETGRGARGTHPLICERHRPTDTVVTNNHFRHVWGAKVCIPCCSEETAQQLSRTESTVHLTFSPKVGSIVMVKNSPLSWSFLMGWLRLVGSLKLQDSLAKESYKRDDILQKRPKMIRRLLRIIRLSCKRFL